MADKSQLSAEAIDNELENLRKQKRSFAVQRAEGLIDAELQQDLVGNLDKRIAELENMKNGVGDSKAATPAESSPDAASDKPEPAHAEANMVEETLENEQSDAVKTADTNELPGAPPVTEASEEPAHAEANVVEDVVESETENTLDEDDDDSPVTEVSEEPEHAQAKMVEEVVEAEQADALKPEDTNELPDAPPVTETSEEPEHAEANVVEELIEDDAPTTSADDRLVIEEEQHPIRREGRNEIQFGKFANDVVVSSAMVKEPDYLDEIHEANVVDIRDITKTYKMGEFELEVLKGITLQVHQGEFISIMGPSGSGKSTLMNILGALDKPTSGEYFLDSVDVSKMNEKQLAEIRNKKIGFVFQSFNLLKRTSALRQVELPLIYGTHKDRTRRAREALEAVGLDQRLHHTPAELSGGQQQRVAIARAIVTEPSMILADEPTGNLDSRSGTEVMQIFQRMNRQNNITTIFVTHDPWIARHTDRVIMLRDGKIIADQRVKEPLVAGESERPSEAQELQAIFENTYYGGDEEEYT